MKSNPLTQTAGRTAYGCTQYANCVSACPCVYGTCEQRTLSDARARARTHASTATNTCRRPARSKPLKCFNQKHCSRAPRAELQDVCQPAAVGAMSDERRIGALMLRTTADEVLPLSTPQHFRMQMQNANSEMVCVCMFCSNPSDLRADKCAVSLPHLLSCNIIT